MVYTANVKKFNAYCFGIQWIGDAFDLVFDVSTNAKECDYGIGGIFTKPQKVSQCRERRYNTNLPIYKLTSSVTAWNMLAVKGDFIRYSCNDAYFDF